MDSREIKELRQVLGLTQQQLSDVIGISVVTISRWERDAFIPSPMAIEKLNQLKKGINKSG